MSVPRVSVVLPIFNRAGTLRRCVDSVRAQTFGDWELVAVDDASSDASAEIFAAVGDPRIRLLRHERNQGASAARNTAIRVARGEFVALVDSDDEWLPGKLERQLADLARTGAGFDVCDHLVRTPGGEHLVEIPTVADWRRTLHTECGLASGSTLVVRHACFERVGLFDEQLRSHEDWDLDLRLARCYPLAITAGALARIHVGAPRSPRSFAAGVEKFLTKHAAEFAEFGAAYHRRVRAHHFASVATIAFAAGERALGWEYLRRAVASAPFLPPRRHAAVLLALVDGALGTELLPRATAWRSRARREPDAGRTP